MLMILNIVIGAVVGGALAGSIVLLEAIVADVVDVDELRHRRKREGRYFGVWKMSSKMSSELMKVSMLSTLLQADKARPSTRRIVKPVRSPR